MDRRAFGFRIDPVWLGRNRFLMGKGGWVYAGHEMERLTKAGILVVMLCAIF
jgi:hypothetical protein